jgi:tRNA-dihydrouridine synthase C
MYSTENFSCPLFLAPMEGLGDLAFRKAAAVIGGFDWACTEFIRVSQNPYIPGLAKEYSPDDTAPIPQAAQLMGSDPTNMALMAKAIEKRGAPRIDLNCGCPSNTVTGKGAGSSLLKTPEHLHAVLCAMVQAVSVPVTAKLRSGFSDTSLFRENILAAQEAGIAFLTLHPRTKEDGYGPPARWDLIAEAKQILKIPLIGNGDILTVDDALRMREQTKCDGLMIGRGAAANPWIFQEIKARFRGEEYKRPEGALRAYFDSFLSGCTELPLRNKISKLKQLINFMAKANPRRLEILSRTYDHERDFVAFSLPILEM